MPNGGYRPGAGRPKTKPPVEPLVSGDVETRLQSGRPYESSLEFAMSVINDPLVPLEPKIRLAIAAMPFQHAKIAEQPASKRSERAIDAAEEAAAGVFAVPTGPRLAVRNR